MSGTPGDAIAVGNAAREGPGRRGWFLGHMIDAEGDPRRTGDVEVKWGEHPAGQPRASWVTNLTATTLSVLVRGRFLVRFADRDVVLAEEGDYVVWGPGVPHTWQALADSIILTVRWPSRAGDSAAVDPPAGRHDPEASFPAERP